MQTTGFQKQVNFIVNNGLPGDSANSTIPITLGGNGKFALNDLIVGNACFLAPNGNQVCSNATTAGSQMVAGIVMRNAGLSPMSWTDSQAGYGYIVPNGTQAQVGTGRLFFALITGVDATGTANHVPVLGEQIYANLTTGAFASAPSSVTSVTGYVPCINWLVNRTGLLNVTLNINVNQTLGYIGGQLAGE